MKKNVFDVTEQRVFIEYIIQNEPPYRRIEFDIEWYNNFLNVNEITVKMFCNNCNSDSVFTAEIKDDITKAMAKDIANTTNRIPINPEFAKKQSIESKVQGKLYFLSFALECAKCGELHFVSILFNENIAVKIGQYPSYTSNEIQDIRKYKNLISKYYPELTKSVSAYSQGMGVASFVYLRRIFEHLVEKEFARIEENPSGKEGFDDKMKKVDKVIGIIPEELNGVKSKIYTVLSKGVHEYEEEECYELYPCMKFVVLQILDRYLYEKQRKERLKSISKLLSNKGD